MSYENNSRNLRQAKKKRMVYVFFVTFFLSMFVVGFIIKSLSPDVDVEIGDKDDDSVTTESVDEESKASGIDDRLKWIQFEDNMPGVSKRMAAQNQDSPTYEGKVKDSPDEKIKEFKNPGHEDSTSTSAKRLSAPVPTRTDVMKQAGTSSEPVRMTKVVVGYYSSVEQAISVQNKLIDSSLNVSPFVKEVNGYYVVQAGSYANRQKAQNLSSQISSMGLPARTISE